MPTAETALPHWDLTAAFPSLDSPEFSRAFDEARHEVAALGALFETAGVRRREDRAVDDGFVRAWEETTQRINALLQGLRTVSAFISCLVTTDATNDSARQWQSLLSTEYAKLDPLLTRYVAWAGTSDVDALLARSEMARDYQYPLRRAMLLARHQMSQAEEELAAALRPASITGWARLHGNMSALLTARVAAPGFPDPLAISAVRSLASDPDRDVRRAAYEAELAAWESVATPFAASLNGVKGYQHVVAQRRGYADDLEPTLLTNGIDRETLEAMQAACVESFPDFRRYLAAKARALGIERCAWYDINAPLGAEARVWSWPEAEQFVLGNFGRYSDRLRGLAQRSFAERWIDAPPHVGKEGGAYCTGLLPGVSRIMMNFDGSFTSVSTLAHELGHAYHNLNLADRTALQRETPMTLAETASIFCETLAFDAALDDAPAGEKLALLDTMLQRNLQTVVDIHSRFLFERAVFAKRAERDLTVAEFNALMLDAQRQTYGDAVSSGHPYMWAVKGHYYGPLFYNYPYTFGLLFGIGLYGRYLADPDDFRARYDDLLSSTGLADAITLGQRFGVDVRDIAFWRSSLDVIRGQIAEFERVVGAA